MCSIYHTQSSGSTAAQKCECKLKPRTRIISSITPKISFLTETYNSTFLKCNHSNPFSFLHSKLPRYPVNVDTYVTITFLTPSVNHTTTNPCKQFSTSVLSPVHTPRSTPDNGTRFSFILIITKRIPIKSSHLPILERVRVPPPARHSGKLAHHSTAAAWCVVWRTSRPKKSCKHFVIFRQVFILPRNPMSASCWLGLHLFSPQTVVPVYTAIQKLECWIFLWGLPELLLNACDDDEPNQSWLYQFMKQAVLLLWPRNCSAIVRR